VTYYLAFDPGLKTGAWAVIDHNGQYIECADIPNDGDRVKPLELKQSILRVIPAGEDVQVVIENVFAMPKQGLSSTAKFMRATGCIEAVAQMIGAVHFVRPQEWKKYYGLIGTEKAQSLAMARAIWPTAPLKLKKHHGRAEALLLAQWGLSTLS
jgi:Holliday junction resolvasome RuvABC endonuclease subunit